MNEKTFAFDTMTIQNPRMGLIALQSDETIEGDLRRLLPADAELMVTRVVSDQEVSRDTLGAMEGHLTAAAALFPENMHFDVIGYGCTSGTAQIGAATVAAKIRAGTQTSKVTQPLDALVAASATLGIRRLAFLSPYVGAVSERLRDVLAAQGVETPVFGTFNVANEATVVRIDPASIKTAAAALLENAPVDGLFLSCTNLRTLDVIDDLEAQWSLPVLSSNQVLAWHMLHATGQRAAADAPGQLFSASGR